MLLALKSKIYFNTHILRGTQILSLRISLINSQISPTSWCPVAQPCQAVALEYCQWAVASLVQQCRKFSRSSKQNLGKLELCGSWRVSIFPLNAWPIPPFLCRALHSYSKILACLDLMNSVGLTLTTPWDPTPPQRSTGTWKVVADFVVSWYCCRRASDPAQVLHLNLYQPDEQHSNLPHTTCIPPKALSVTQPKKQPSGGGRWRWISGCLGLFSDLTPNSVLVEAGIIAQLGSSSIHLSSVEAAINSGLLCSSKQDELH